MNWYFYKIFLPLACLTILSIVGVTLGFVEIFWPAVFIVWFLIGPVGIGVGYHRLFSHRQFETPRFFELSLAFLGTLAAYAPILFWVSNHQYHHRHSDDKSDPSSPKWHGFWETFIWYRLRKSTLEKVDIKNYCTRTLIKDPALRGLSRHFTKIVWCAILLSLAFGVNTLVSFYLLPVLIEHIRINLVTAASHTNIPFSYRNHETGDDSFNNYVLGYLTFGFAWHNNHHHNERKLILQYKWWEFDIEGCIARLISRKPTLPLKN